MSGMFYSLEEAAQKLSKTKEEVKKLVKEGQLREFRDGPNILFKADEVEALIPQDDISGPSDETEIIELATEETEPEIVDEEMSMPESEPEPEMQDDAEIPEMPAEEPEVTDEEPMELGLQPESEKKPAEPDDFIDFNADTSMPELSEEAAEPEAEPGDSMDNIFLASESAAPADENDLSSGDTAILGQGTSILGQSDNKEYDLTDDTMADTVILDGTKGGSGLEETEEEDLSLDSFGSGSGLLDLSLQADDTSLGGILDEIYTDENKEPAAGDAQEPDLDAGMHEESGELAPAGIGEEALAPQIENVPGMAFGVGAVEVPPDSQSNILGTLLFIPLIAVLYAVIVTFAGSKGIVPSILMVIEEFIWYVIAGLAVITAAIAAAAFMLTGEKKAPVAKEKKVKVKKEKAPKVKKEKVIKPKKEKPPKPDKKAKRK